MLTLHDVSAGYGRAEVLHGVSLSVRENEIVCLLGSNGAGKTTTLMTVLGVLKPRRGTITFLGDPISGCPTPGVVRRGIAIVPEGRRVFGPMTVEENLQIGAAVHSVPRLSGEDFDRVFEIFPVLSERRRQLAGTLSGGQQQMLAIARALMARPRLLLMDEPAMGLSPVLAEQVFDVIRGIAEKGVSVLLVEQNVFASLSIASRGYVMQGGIIALEGAAATLLDTDLVREAYL